MILVAHEGGATYHVTLTHDGDMTTHIVNVWPSDIARYAPSATPEELLEASFDFLLDRTPRESILAQFELPIIERDFPDYLQAMDRRFQ
jgi:hypothetical protein